MRSIDNVEQLGDFAALPPECLYEILSHCDATTIAVLGSVNHLFKNFTNDPVSRLLPAFHEFVNVVI